MEDFEDHFQLNFVFDISNFEPGRHFISPEMKRPSCDILYRSARFDVLSFTFNQYDANRYMTLAQDPILDFIQEYLLKPESKEDQETYDTTLDARILEFKAIDSRLLHFFLGAQQNQYSLRIQRTLSGSKVTTESIPRRFMNFNYFAI
jgi:hypothetical protein